MRGTNLISRSAVVGALLGLSVGVLEAARLYFVPAEPLLVPNVRYGIWFVAPFVDLVIGGLFGFAFGLLVALLCRAPGAIAKLTAAGLGAGATFLACFIVQIVSPLRAGKVDPTTSWCFFMAIFVPVLLAWYRHSRGPFQRLLASGEAPLPKGLLATLLVSIGVLLLGVLVLEGQGVLTPPSVRAGSAPAPNRPNVVLITLDTVRADHLSLYGYGRPTTPNLDGWARQGVVFDHAVAASSWTLASHTSVFTGLLPHQHGANWSTPADTARWTLAEVLMAYGYDTAGFSANVYYGEAGWGMEHGFEVYDDATGSVRHNLQVTFAGDRLLQPFYYSFVEPNRFDRINAAQVNLNVSRWLQRRSGRPFFLFVNYFDAHSPYLPPPPYNRRFGLASDALLRKAQPVLGDGNPSHRLSQKDREAVIANYDNCLAYLDEQVGRLLDALSHQPEWSNTVVIITSDHGEAFGEHGFYGHGNETHQETIHVPLIMLGPGVPRGLRLAHVVATRKLFATVLDMALGIGQPFYSNSLRHSWMPDFEPGPYGDVAVSELAPRGNAHPGYISLATSKWHYVLDSRGDKELYRWIDDPEESANLAEDYPQEVQALDAILRDRVASSLGPWAEPLYLSALVPEGSPPTQGTAFGLRSDLKPADLLHRVGMSQAYFPPRSSSGTAQPRVPDRELLESLPYH